MKTLISLTLMFVAAACGRSVETSTETSTPTEAAPQEARILKSLTVACRQVNDFGYAGAVTGTLAAGEPRFDGSIPLSGALTVWLTNFVNDSHRELQNVEVTGTLSAKGDSAELTVKGGLQLTQLNLLLGVDRPQSALVEGDTEYQTDCSEIP